MTWREYHELTKHSVESLRRTQQYLDWANMPNPFRHYEGVPVLDLPADPPAPQISALEVLEGKTAKNSAGDGAGFLSQLMFYSASISASKRVPSTGGTYALRVNPSSGNLHPTEFHFCTHGLVDWSDGLYHYRPSSHMAEQRAVGDFGSKLIDTHAPLVFVLTSIAWREAWKYRDRAYRGDQRLVAAALSLGQDLAGNACVAFSMIGDFENAARNFGDRGYRYVHFEAGAIGQRMYLASEALGLRATGIGAFFDEEVNRYLGLTPELEQVVYHFAIGYPIPDPRLEA
jgi:nitroreductase